MHRTTPSIQDLGFTRRGFVSGAAALSAAALTGVSGKAFALGEEVIKVGVIGCGGRGTGAASDSLAASPLTRIVALADVFEDRLKSSRNYLTSSEDIDPANRSRVQIADDKCYVGFDAYKRLIAEGGVDLVILATPPHFRPIHLTAAVAAGKHAFVEKPVAVDPAGVRSVLASGLAAADKKLSIVAGTQRRHETSYLAAMKRLQGGFIGKPIAARCYWNQGGLWMNPRKSEWSDMEWQLRNWLYFTWLSGDHICEQHVHNLDVVNWAMGDHPTRCLGMGGRQVRTDPAYGHIFDHFTIEYEYPSGARLTSMCRQIPGCADRVEEQIQGTSGIAYLSPGRADIQGERPWKFAETNGNPYVQEHIDLIRAITTGTPVNEARNVAEATLTAIMGRMSAYTGKELTWDQALNSPLDLAPTAYAMGTLATPEVAIPGVTPLV